MHRILRLMELVEIYHWKSKQLPCIMALIEIDLHGFRVQEAVNYVAEVLVRIINDNSASFLLIVTGRGKHSRNGMPKIRPAIESFFKKESLHVYF